MRMLYMKQHFICLVNHLPRSKSFPESVIFDINSGGSREIGLFMSWRVSRRVWTLSS